MRKHIPFLRVKRNKKIKDSKSKKSLAVKLNLSSPTHIIIDRSHAIVQWNLDLRKPDLRKNLDLRKIVATTDFLVHKLFDLRKIF